MTAPLRARRIETVKRETALEVTHERDEVVAMLERTRYKLNGSDAVFNGEEAVRSCFASSRAPFPEQGNENIAIVHADDTVLFGFALTSTHPASLKRDQKIMAPT
jgi:hypothetical protein